jgi:hypothetical protein
MFTIRTEHISAPRHPDFIPDPIRLDPSQACHHLYDLAVSLIMAVPACMPCSLGALTMLPSLRQHACDAPQHA